MNLIICGGPSPWYAPAWPEEPRCKKHGRSRRMDYRRASDAYVCTRRDCDAVVPFKEHWEALPEDYRSNHRSDINERGRRFVSYSHELLHHWSNVSGDLPPVSHHYEAYSYLHPETMAEAAELATV